MLLAMRSDYLYEEKVVSYSGYGVLTSTNLGGIDASPTSKDYPNPSKYSDLTVKYKRPGGFFDAFNAIMPKANRLHTDLFGTPFEQGGYGVDEVTRAEQILQQNSPTLSKYCTTSKSSWSRSSWGSWSRGNWGSRSRPPQK